MLSIVIHVHVQVNCCNLNNFKNVNGANDNSEICNWHKSILPGHLPFQCTRLIHCEALISFFNLPSDF